MGNEKKLRLIRVAKEFNVGLSTITDFLHRKGIEVDSSPNAPIDTDTYAILEKEFGKNRPSGNELDSVREKINKKTSVSIEPEAKPKEEKRSIEIKDEVVQPKILGKIDLEPKKKKEEAAPAPKAEPVVEAPKAEVKVEVKVEAPKEEVKPVPAPKAEPIVVEEPKEEPKKSEVFRATEAPTLAGPQILGTMDVSGMVAGGKRHRKRLEKAKVDISKQQNNAPKGGNQGQQNDKNNKFNNNKQQNNQNQQQNQGGGKKNKQKPQPKPVVRPEVSDEEVSQVLHISRNTYSA